MEGTSSPEGSSLPLSPTASDRRELRIATALLLAALLAAGLLRGGMVSGKGWVANDEGISYLAATGHQAEYALVTSERRPPYGTRTPAANWKRLVNPGEKGALGRIGPDLARYDIHPPLYFWLLHFCLYWICHYWNVVWYW